MRQGIRWRSAITRRAQPIHRRRPRSAAPGAGLGWPERALTSRAHSVRPDSAARIGGLGWPGNPGSVPIMSAPIMSGQSAGQGSRGVLVNEARSEADGGEVRETFGSGTGAQRPDQAATRFHVKPAPWSSPISRRIQRTLRSPGPRRRPSGYVAAASPGRDRRVAGS
jgi:hypothetical protein